MSLPPYVSRDFVQKRLEEIFPEGSASRNFCTRQIAASTVFVMLYTGAVEGSDRYVAPRQIYWMGDEQAAMTTDAARLEYAANSKGLRYVPTGTRWYADNTREPIRDETLRQGLIPVGAAMDKPGIGVTSNAPRYALKADFAALFDPELTDVEARIEEWRESHLSASARARIAIVRAGAAANPDDFLVTFPNGNTQRLTPGDSSVITKQVIEKFAPRYLERPAVLWVSESGNRVVVQHDVLARQIGLAFDAGRLLPDIVLVDTSDEHLLLVFVEVVASDGPITEMRRSDLLKRATEAGFDEKNTAFVTAFMDRTSRALKRRLADLAWNTFVWIASEPDGLISLSKPDNAPPFLHRMLATGGTRS